MILWDLFFGFLQVGCFAFGGAYGAIPLIRDVVLSYGWLSDEALTYMIAVSESTPGPIMINLATYVGSSQAGMLGAALATFAVVLPSFVVTLVVMAILQNIMKHPYVQAILRGLKPCVIGIILATGVTMILGNCFSLTGQSPVQAEALVVTGLLAAVGLCSRRFRKKKLSSIQLILLAALVGAIVY